MSNPHDENNHGNPHHDFEEEALGYLGRIAESLEAIAATLEKQSPQSEPKQSG